MKWSKLLLQLQKQARKEAVILHQSEQVLPISSPPQLQHPVPTSVVVNPEIFQSPPKYEDLFPHATTHNQHIWKVSLDFFLSRWFNVYDIENWLYHHILFFVDSPISQNLNDSDIEGIEAISHRLGKWTKAIRDDKKQKFLVKERLNVNPRSLESLPFPSFRPSKKVQRPFQTFSQRVSKKSTSLRVLPK